MGFKATCRDGGIGILFEVSDGLYEVLVLHVKYIHENDTMVSENIHSTKIRTRGEYIGDAGAQNFRIEALGKVGVKPLRSLFFDWSGTRDLIFVLNLRYRPNLLSALRSD